MYYRYSEESKPCSKFFFIIRSIFYECFFLIVLTCIVPDSFSLSSNLLTLLLAPHDRQRIRGLSSSVTFLTSTVKNKTKQTKIFKKECNTFSWQYWTTCTIALPFRCTCMLCQHIKNCPSKSNLFGYCSWHTKFLLISGWYFAQILMSNFWYVAIRVFKMVNEKCCLFWDTLY